MKYTPAELVQWVKTLKPFEVGDMIRLRPDFHSDYFMSHGIDYEILRVEFNYQTELWGGRVIWFHGDHGLACAAEIYFVYAPKLNKHCFELSDG
jgi:hypothetical protein